MPFRDLRGHRRTLALLTRAVAQGTLPPSLQFTGPDGIGKRLAALALAETLNCAQPRREVVSAHEGTGPGMDACGECASCRRIRRGVHPDVIILEPNPDTGTIKIEDVRGLTERLGYRPFEARWRVVVIDRAEALVVAAQNALLKTLEEPPASSVFVLVTARPDALLPTVRSRCPQIRFAPLAVAEVAEILVGSGLAPREAQALAAVSGGSASAALDTGSVSLAGARTAAERLLARLATARDARARLGAAVEIVGKSAKGTGAGERESLATHLRAVHALLRDLGVMAVAGGERAVANVDLVPSLARLAASYDRARLVAAFAAVDRALEALERNASPKIVADWVVLQV